MGLAMDGADPLNFGTTDGLRENGLFSTSQIVAKLVPHTPPFQSSTTFLFLGSSRHGRLGMFAVPSIRTRKTSSERGRAV